MKLAPVRWIWFLLMNSDQQQASPTATVETLDIKLKPIFSFLGLSVENNFDPYFHYRWVDEPSSTSTYHWHLESIIDVTNLVHRILYSLIGTLKNSMYSYKYRYLRMQWYGSDHPGFLFVCNQGVVYVAISVFFKHGIGAAWCWDYVMMGYLSDARLLGCSCWLQWWEETAWRKKRN